MTRLTVLALLALAACADVEQRKNILLISIDTLRADRLGCYGYARDTSPALDRFAHERAVRFEHAIAESPWTLPSHVSLLSGLHPLTHGVRLPDQAPTVQVELLAESLAREGYETFALTDGGWLSEAWGFERGFRSFEAIDTDLAQTVDDAIAYIDFLSRRGAWFGFLHTYDVHCPYDPPEPYFSRFVAPESEAIEVAGRCGNPHFNELELSPGQVAYLSDRYDGGVLWADTALARLFAFLDETDAWEDTIVVVTSDHGEELGEHGRIGHERTLHGEVLHIPLLLAAPGHAASVVSTPVGLIDVVPTVLELAGIATPDGLDGRSLVPLLTGGGGRPEGCLSDLAWMKELASRMDAGEHAILDLATGELELYDRRRDPREQHDRCGEESARCDELARALTAEVRRREQTVLPTLEVQIDTQEGD